MPADLQGYSVTSTKDRNDADGVTAQCSPSSGYRYSLLLGAGIILLLADLVARFGAQIVHTAHASAMPALYLSLALTLLVIPVGAAVGKLATKFWPLP